MFSGEIDNLDEILFLRLTPDERPPELSPESAALALYEKYGMAFASFIHGQFALAIWDRSIPRLILANDRYGLIPVYYALHSKRLIFAPLAHAVITGADRPGQPDDEAVSDLLSFGYPLNDRTLFKEVRLLPPASTAVFENGNLTVLSCRDFASVPDAERWSDEEAFNELRQRFLRSVERRLSGRVLLPLSAGLDSRAILAAIPRQTPLTAYTFGDADSADRVYGRKLAQAAGLRHIGYDLTPEDLLNYAEEAVTLTDGMLDLLNTHGISTAEHLKEHGDWILSGLGGELLRNFFGYPGGNTDPSAYLFRHIRSVFSEEDLATLLTPEYFGRIQGCAEVSFRKVFSRTLDLESPFDRCDAFYLQQRVRRFTLSGALLFGSRLGYRAPFLDDDFIDGVLHTRPSLKIGSRFHRLFIQRMAPDLSRIPLGSANEPLTPTLRYRVLRRARTWLRMPGPPRPRASIVDYPSWLRNELSGFIRNILLDKRTLERGYFRREYLERLADTPRSERINTAGLSVLVTLELWHRLFID
jgi:asparagine synthase (glutamine-hydrolysing)